MPDSSNLGTLHGCGWDTVSLAASEMKRVDEAARATHVGRAIVSSCQRLEAFGVEACDCGAPEAWMGEDAVLRLAEVAAGLHSVVLGEEQIIGQVRAAFAELGGPLRGAADLAIAAARQLRRETRFDSHAGHLLDRGLQVAGVSPTGTLLVLGAGAMGRLVAQRGSELGFPRVIVASRAEPGGANGWRPEWVPLMQSASLGRVDVIAGCLGSGAGEIPAHELPAASLAIDLGTPRNFGDWTGALVTIGDLLEDEESRPHARRRRQELRSRLAEIVSQRTLASRSASDSAVGALRFEVEKVRQRELARMRRLHPEVAPDTLDVLTRSLVEQIFHRPSVRLRHAADESLGMEVVALFADS
ncbi:MAG: hypothetical protein ABI782_01165 [Anaerolineaceae bacterium]